MKLGFLFPGQGAQRVGMLDDLSQRSALVGRRFEEASEALGFDLAKMVRQGPQQALNSTENTQPALLAASVALHDLWHESGGAAPTWLAGHSLGEYSALTVAGVLEFAAAVCLVHERGKLMQQAVPAGEGRMAAIIGLDDATVADCCAAVPGVVAPANYNSPGQVVIAGETSAVAAAIAACTEAGARRAVPLEVSVPSHCPLMQPAAERLGTLLDAATLKDADIPVVQNVSAAASREASVIRANLLRQLVAPVRWSQSVSSMAAAGVDTFVECGPGNVLAGLVRRIDRRFAVHGIGAADGFDAALAALPA